VVVPEQHVETKTAEKRLKSVLEIVSNAGAKPLPPHEGITTDIYHSTVAKPHERMPSIAVSRGVPWMRALWMPSRLRPCGQDESHREKIGK
jgi:hypothetical protein